MSKGVPHKPAGTLIPEPWLCLLSLPSPHSLWASPMQVQWGAEVPSVNTVLPQGTPSEGAGKAGTSTPL